jgi:hypothetical protein
MDDHHFFFDIWQVSCGELSPFCEKRIFCQNFPVLNKIIQIKMKKNLQKLPQMA